MNLVVTAIAKEKYKCYNVDHQELISTILERKNTQKD